jgi:hypothetical protein
MFTAAVALGKILDQSVHWITLGTGIGHETVLR